jgi:2-keto-4-pentenoate hydratase
MANFRSDPRIEKGMQAQAALRTQRLAAGAKLVGWKAGFGSAAAMERLKIDGPLAGFLLDKAVVKSGDTVPLAGWTKPVAEPEIAVWLGRDLAAGADRATVKAAVAALGPAIELADIDGPLDDVERALAGDIFQRHVVLGPRDETRAGVKLDGLTGRVTRAGAEIAAPDNLETNIGEIVGIVQHVANLMGHFGDTLRAGQFIITGSVVPPLFLEAADTRVAWRLDPVGGVEVRFRW